LFRHPPVHGHYRQAWHYTSGGTGSVAAGHFHSSFCNRFCRYGARHARRTGCHLFGRSVARTLGWEVSLVATGLDYWHTRGPVTTYRPTYYAPGYRYGLYHRYI
jgi:hypothetical protein